MYLNKLEHCVFGHLAEVKLVHHDQRLQSVDGGQLVDSLQLALDLDGLNQQQMN